MSYRNIEALTPLEQELVTRAHLRELDDANRRIVDQLVNRALSSRDHLPTDEKSLTEMFEQAAVEEVQKN